MEERLLLVAPEFEQLGRLARVRCYVVKVFEFLVGFQCVCLATGEGLETLLGDPFRLTHQVLLAEDIQLVSNVRRGHVDARLVHRELRQFLEVLVPTVVLLLWLDLNCSPTDLVHRATVVQPLVEYRSDSIFLVLLE